MKIPSIKNANAYLEWAYNCNPGPWADHSRIVSKAAKRIAKASGLDPDVAEVLGLLHDLGRYKGVTNMMHIYDGYLYLMENGYPDAAQICITHSFPIQNIQVYSGANDCSDEISSEIQRILYTSVYTDYDRLIQLCDSIALPQGVCLLEKRLLDVALRHGVNNYTVPKWKEIFNIWNHFTQLSGINLYSLFEEVEQVTFSR